MDQEVSSELIEAGRGYEDLFVPALFECWTSHLIEGADVKAGADVLDIACGTGVLTRKALSKAGPGNRIVGVDPAPGMLSVAKEIEPAIEWILGSAETLTFENETFDSVMSQFGMMFFDDRPKAASEMHRVLKTGGSLAVAVWNSTKENPAYKDIIALLGKSVSAAAADAVRLPFCLGDPKTVTSALASAGFANIAVGTETEKAVFPSVRSMVEAELRGWLPIFDIVLSDTEIEVVLSEADHVLSKYAKPSGEAIFPTSAHVITAQKT